MKILLCWRLSLLGLSRLETLSQFLKSSSWRKPKSISLNEDPALLRLSLLGLSRWREAKSISLNEDPACWRLSLLGVVSLETLSQFLVIIQLEEAKSISSNEDPALLEIASSWGCSRFETLSQFLVLIQLE
ncbi:hypothetical protein CDAR_89471 [Caerostris darwini]|uniref:Uncharacterized protein n=1 Tax=Caerostris darwini TaxID=1538125 RepID=A0AAV4N629_9ARAC|nr:hypothetical protein CDAR_89471 [Caerostris darwini]